MNNEEINMVTCTPLLGGRKLADTVPQSPFLVSNQTRKDATPVINAQVRVQGELRPMTLGGVVINRAAGAGANAG